MKQATLLILFAAIFSSAGSAAGIHSLKTSADSSLFKATVMQDMLEQIKKTIGTTEDFEMKAADVLNIEATIAHRKKYILYNPAFIESLQNATKDNWSVMALLAHEVGHHLNKHTSHRPYNRPKQELEADEFAGFVLYKLGATLQQSQNVMFFIARTEASKSHPARASRLQAIENGWRKAAAITTRS